MLSALTDWGSFVSDKYKLFLYAPPKCASTSILTALVNLVDPEAEVPNCLTSENLSSLDIHPYVRDHHAPTKQCISNAFANPDYCKILVLRDPLSRFLSAIASKYLIGFGPYAQELSLGSTIKHELKKNYSDIQNLKDDVNFVSKRLLTALSLGSSVSHVRPISGSFSEKDLSLFDCIFDVSNPEFSDNFLSSINQHLQQFGVSVDALPRFNESPLSIPADFLEPSILDSILQVYHDDYILLGKDRPKMSDILSSDFDLTVFSQKNLDKLSLSVLFYDVSSKFYQKDHELTLEKEKASSRAQKLKKDKDELILEKEKASSRAQKLKKDKDELILEKEKALACAQNLKLKNEEAQAYSRNLEKKVKQLKLKINELNDQDKYRILHIVQLQDDLDELLADKGKVAKAMVILNKQQQQLISSLFDLIAKISS